MIYTARLDWADGPKLDITYKGQDPLGRYFAPSWATLGPVLTARRHSPAAAEALWPAYVTRYTGEMRASYRTHRWAWDVVLDPPTTTPTPITLVCFCVDPARCHRTLLAGILGKLGAEIGGEHPQPPPRQGQLFGAELCRCGHWYADHPAGDRLTVGRCRVDACGCALFAMAGP